MKVVQETLGLSSITIAADTYTSFLPQLARQSAEDAAALVRPSQIPSPRRRTRQTAKARAHIGSPPEGRVITGRDTASRPRKGPARRTPKVMLQRAALYLPLTTR